MFQDFWSSFVKVVQATPQAVALEMPYTSWSYQQLSEKALKIGSYLQALGGQPGELVSLALPKSPEYIVALLGAWSAGMAFVPIDPSLPSARQDWLKEHAQANYQLDAKILTHLKNQTISPNLPIRPQPEDWAYLIYTSGSTGHPKGVCIPHRGLVSVLTEQIVIFGLKPGKKALWFLSPQFDASLSDIGTALLSGATLCLAKEPLIPSPQVFYTLLAQRKITHLDLPPALLHVLDPDAFPACFETLMIGGEAAPIEEVRRWSAKFRVINIYGPTEATICTSLGECGPDWNAPLLGKPLSEVAYQLLDETGNSSDEGELWIAAPGLAWGYHREPKLSAERFVWWTGKRWYRTGDKVRRIGDSYLFLGRLDRQLKLQGRLLAPEEIEQSLQKHPALAEVAIIEKAGGLVAFFTVMAGTVLPTHSELNAFLREKLPPWMIPVRYYCQSDLPRTPTGKIDYPALARLDLTTQEYSRPAQAITPLGQQLHQIWQRVLETETIGLNSDFFALGGNSIKVIQAVGLAYAQGLWLHPELFYTQPVFQAQLAALESLVKGQSLMSAIPLRQSVLAYSPHFLPLTQDPQKSRGSITAPLLLTGATGFLGARFLLELLKNTATPIYCLIRANSESDALSRLNRALKPYQNLLPDHWQKRVLMCCGDLTLPQLGLPQASWNELSQTLGAIYHSGAWVNQILPYAALAPTNLQGTQTLAKLAWTGKVKPLHYLSTLSVFVATDQNQGLLLESDDLSTTQAIYGGYAQSKWAAEIWLRKMGQDYPLAIYRLGLITGDSVTGYSPERDWLRLLSLGLLDLGYLPRVENSNLAMDITPVDLAAESILKLSFQGPLQTYHLANAHPLYLSDYLAYLEAHYGLASLPLQAWLTHLKAYLEQSPELAVTTALLALCRQLSVQDYTQYRSLDLFQRTNLRFDMRQTLAVLSDFACPPPDAALLTRYFKAFHGELL